jgi:phosphoribosylaminoimidazole carboxylase (NCAIR synthetase)
MGNTSIVNAVIIAIGIVVVGVLLSMQLGRMTKDAAIDGCLKLVAVEKNDNGTMIRVPEEYWYNYCMDKKGYEVQEEE